MPARAPSPHTLASEKMASAPIIAPPTSTSPAAIPRRPPPHPAAPDALLFACAVAGQNNDLGPVHSALLCGPDKRLQTKHLLAALYGGAPSYETVSELLGLALFDVDFALLLEDQNATKLCHASRMLLSKGGIVARWFPPQRDMHFQNTLIKWCMEHERFKFTKRDVKPTSLASGSDRNCLGTRTSSDP